MKIKLIWAKIKSLCHLDEKEYKNLYATLSQPRLFYGRAKVHKLQTREGLKELRIRPIISIIWTATYKTAKYPNTNGKVVF